ncbi:MAG TPA: GerMN domain-containing protein [Thermoanaerobaculia bacterium]|nr:GerMN domain-containing protein [Thermoanaerobaculia bacterium]
MARATCIGGIAALALLAIATGCRKERPLSSNLNVENKVALRQVVLYYESADFLLAPERRNVPLPENPAGAVPVVLRELVKGPATPDAVRVLPPDTVLRGAYLLPEGTVIVDLGGTTLMDGWHTGSHEELMAVYSVIETVTANFPQAKRVRLLINGEPAETMAGHISLAKSLPRSAALVGPAAR